MSVAKRKELAKYLLAVITTTITMMIWARESTGCGSGAPRDFLSYSVFFNRGGFYYVHSSDVFWGIILVNSLLSSVKPQLGSFAETSDVLLLLCNLREPVTNLNLGSFCLCGSFCLVETCILLCQTQEQDLKLPAHPFIKNIPSSVCSLWH